MPVESRAVAATSMALGEHWSTATSRVRTPRGRGRPEMESGKETQAGIGDPGSGIRNSESESAISNPESPSESTVEPHALNVVAWDIPSAIVSGAKFRIKVGIKCALECDLANTDFGIYDHEGALVARGMFPAEHW